MNRRIPRTKLCWVTGLEMRFLGIAQSQFRGFGDYSQDIGKVDRRLFKRRRSAAKRRA